MKKSIATIGLTPSQEKVVSDTVNEFLKANKEEANKPKGGLIDMEGFVSQRTEDLATIAKIKIDNAKTIEIYKGIVNSAVERLNADLLSHGIAAKVSHEERQWSRIIIDRASTIITTKTDAAIIIDFVYETKTIGFISGVLNVSKLYPPEDAKKRYFRIANFAMSCTDAKYFEIDDLTKTNYLFNSLLKRLYNYIHQ